MLQLDLYEVYRKRFGSVWIAASEAVVLDDGFGQSHFEVDLVCLLTTGLNEIDVSLLEALAANALHEEFDRSDVDGLRAHDARERWGTGFPFLSNRTRVDGAPRYFL